MCFMLLPGHADRSGSCSSALKWHPPVQAHDDPRTCRARLRSLPNEAATRDFFTCDVNKKRSPTRLTLTKERNLKPILRFSVGMCSPQNYATIRFSCCLASLCSPSDRSAQIDPGRVNGLSPRSPLLSSPIPLCFPSVTFIIDSVLPSIPFFSLSYNRWARPLILSPSDRSPLSTSTPTTAPRTFSPRCSPPCPSSPRLSSCSLPLLPMLFPSRRTATGAPSPSRHRTRTPPLAAAASASPASGPLGRNNNAGVTLSPIPRSS